MRGIIAFLVGLLFALGLGYSGMTQTHIVKGFLDVFGEWNISLIGVMAGAIFVHSIIYHLIRKKQSPFLDTKFYLPIKKDIDKRLLAGAAIFGIGWGWVGICPGPGIVSLASGQISIIVFVGAMVVGMILFKFVEKKKC
jgi:uncharacterized membrane protein YedE/YeeE